MKSKAFGGKYILYNISKKNATNRNMNAGSSNQIEKSFPDESQCSVFSLRLFKERRNWTDPKWLTMSATDGT